VKIKSVKLENFKSHVASNISFSPGLNLIIGPNGSGKSSILQAIGLAFFGITNNINLSKFITNDGKNNRATVKIEFETDDGMNYVLTREISGRGQSRVSLVDGSGIAVENATRVNEKIRQIFQISSNNPEDIYKNVITAYQNDITDIFARTPSKRNEFFNALFNTEIYKSISSTHVKNYADRLQKELDDLNAKAQYLASEVEKEKALDEVMIQTKNEMNEVQREIDELEGQRSNANDFIDKQTKIGDEIKTLSSKRSMLQVKAEGLQKQMGKLLKDADESKKSSQILERYLQDYNRYVELSKKIKNSNDEISKIMKLLDEIAVVKDNISSKKMEKERISSTMEADKSKILENQKEIEARSQDIVNYGKTIDDLRSELERSENLYKSIVERIEEVKTYLNGKNYSAISNFFRSEDKKLFDEFCGEIEDEEKLRALLDQKHRSIMEKNSKIEEFSKAKSMLSDGICPYLKEECLNIKGDAAAYFDPLIKELKDELLNLEKQKSEIEDKISRNVKIEKERATLVEKLLNEMEQEEKAVYQKVTKIKSDIEFQMKQVDLLQKRKEELNSMNDKLKRKISETSKKIDLVDKDIDELSAKIVEEKELRQKLALLQEERARDQEEMQKVSKGYELYNQNKITASRLDEINRELAVLKDQSSELEIEIQKITSEIKELDNSYKEQDLQKAKLELDRINEKIGSLRQKFGELNGSMSEKLKIKREIEEKKSQLEEIKKAINKKTVKKSFAGYLRNLLDNMGSEVSSAYRELISSEATDKYNMMTKRSDMVRWTQDYELHLLTYIGNTPSDKVFEMLSGGEQISLALSMRMAMVNFFSRSGFAIFDEPTVNLDSDRRGTLSESLPKLLENMDQVIVVTHDDTFKEMTEKIIMLKNIDGVTTVEN